MSAATTRTNNGLFAKANRTTDRTTGLNLTNSEFSIDTVIDTASFSLFWANQNLFYEANFSSQRGTKSTSSLVDTTAVGTPEKSSNNSINLLSLQLGLGYRQANWSFGLKQIIAPARYKSLTDYSFTTDTGKTTVNEDSDLNSTFLVTGLSAVTKIWSPNLYFSVGADFFQMGTKQTLIGSLDSTIDGNTNRTTVNLVDEKKTIVIKQIYGLAYLTRSADSSFRAELSYERMPPLAKSSDAKPGEKIRGTMEATWRSFHGGVEGSYKKGYYVDPNSLTPYYFKFEHLTEQPTTEYGFFGGFKLSKGHGIGASYSESKVKTAERLSATDPTNYDIERGSRTYSISYSYVF